MQFAEGMLKSADAQAVRRKTGLVGRGTGGENAASRGFARQLRTDVMRMHSWVGLTLLLLAGIALGDDPPSADDECRLLDIPKCHIHVIDRALLAAERDGVLREIGVKVGDVVPQGAPLVRLQDAIAAANLEHAQVRANSDVNVRYAIEVMDTAKEEFDQATSLRSQNAINDQTFRQRRLEYDRSVLSKEQSEFDFRLAGLQAKQAEAELKAYHVEAPFAGTVRQVMKVPGESIRDGEPILELVNTDRVQVEGYGSLEDLFNLLPGAPVEVWLDAPELDRFGITKERFRGKLIHVDDIVQPVTGKVRVVAEVANRSNILRDGLRANLQIQIRPKNLSPLTGGGNAGSR